MFPRCASVTHLLQQCLFAILKQAPLILERYANFIKDGFCYSLEGLLQFSPGDDYTKATYGDARSKALHSYLDKNLACPNLDVDRLSKEFDIPKPTVTEISSRLAALRSTSSGGVWTAFFFACFGSVAIRENSGNRRQGSVSMTRPASASCFACALASRHHR